MNMMSAQEIADVETVPPAWLTYEKMKEWLAVDQSSSASSSSAVPPTEDAQPLLSLSSGELFQKLRASQGATNKQLQ